MDTNNKILVLGGTGNFGARICRRLAGVPGIELVVSSRDKSRAEVLTEEILRCNPDSSISAHALDQESIDFETKLRAISPFAVIHTAGPYQGQDYRVARACIDARSHYVDLADGREFVVGFGSLHRQARDAGVMLVSGASTLPGLSSAVIDSLRDEFSQIESVEMSIALAQQTPRGTGTIAAVLSYCGRPFSALVSGEWRTKYGWQDIRVQQFPRLGKRLSAACDVPDLELLPQFVPGVETVSFHAAIEAAWEHAVLWLMAWMTRIKLVSNWSRYAARFAALSRTLGSLGSDRGGMIVSLKGRGLNGKQLEIDWSLMADENHGPEIPCTPAIVLVRKMLRREYLEPGAVPCMNLVTVEELMADLSEFSISTMVEKRG